MPTNESFIFFASSVFFVGGIFGVRSPLIQARRSARLLATCPANPREHLQDLHDRHHARAALCDPIAPSSRWDST
jgi:hypothetical protein